MRALQSLSEIVDDFDGLILDLWGLIHDGVTAYPGVADALAHLKGTGIKTILLSNAPRRSQQLVTAMANMGIDRALYGDVFSSGEATWEELRSRRDPFFSSLGDAVYHVGPERDHSVLEETSIARVDVLQDADFILNTGPVELSHTLTDYEPLLAEAIDMNLPMVCANPDEVVIRDGQRVICAGAIARRYESLGGAVVYRGKPDPAVYHLACDRLEIDDRARVAVIGDALETDVAGGEAAGISAIWCTGGIHAEALGVRYGQPADLDRAKRLAQEHQRAPWAIIPGFQW